MPDCLILTVALKMFKPSFLTICLVLALAAVISAEDNVPLIKTAMEVLARATSSSQVLSFNLTGDFNTRDLIKSWR